jgi:prolyl 4-hydroxylase
MQIQILNQAVTPELREWILAQAQAGCAHADILKAMLASGWDDAVARGALAQTLQPGPAQAALPQLQAVPAGSGSPCPNPTCAARRR